MAVLSETESESEQTCCDDGISSLSGSSLEKARQELNEDPATRHKAIQELRDKIKSWKPSKTEEKLVVLGRTNDKSLLKFLRARKFDIDKSLQLYVNYHAFRAKHSSMLQDLDLKAIEHVLHSGVIEVLDSRFKDGSKALCVYPAKWDATTFPFVDNFRATLLVLEKLVEDEETQVHGFSVIYDFTDSCIMSMLSVTQSELITKGVLFELLQDSFPGRFKGVHLVKQPWYISFVLRVIQPFMKQKLRERIHSHGYDLDSLHSFINSEGLPVELGGSLVDHNATFALFKEDR